MTNQKNLEKETAIDGLIKTVVHSAYQCGHEDAPSFCVPEYEKVYGVKKLKEALTTLEKETIERCAKVADNSGHTYASEEIAQAIRNLGRGE